MWSLELSSELDLVAVRLKCSRLSRATVALDQEDTSDHRIRLRVHTVNLVCVERDPFVGPVVSLASQSVSLNRLC